MRKIQIILILSCFIIGCASNNKEATSKETIKDKIINKWWKRESGSEIFKFTEGDSIIELNGLVTLNYKINNDSIKILQNNKLLISEKIKELTENEFSIINSNKPKESLELRTAHTEDFLIGIWIEAINNSEN